MDIRFNRTIPLYPNAVFLQWDILNAPAEALTLELFRSGSPGGSWTSVATFTDTYNYTDTLPTAVAEDPHVLTLNKGIFYKLTASSSGDTVSVVTAVEPELDGRQRLLKRKMIRDESVLLRKLNGVQVAVLKRKHWGTRCTKCYDPYTKQAVRSGCTVCYGTTFAGGYYSPIITLARRGVTPVVSQISQTGKTDVGVTQVTMLDAPFVQDEDILVFTRDNRRYEVKSVITTELKTVVIHQKLLVSELGRSAIEYRIKVDPDRSPKLF